MDGAVTRRIIERATWVYVNETEAQAITGLASEDADRLAGALLRFSGRPEWILTLGSKGSCSIRKGEAILKQGIFPVQAADTTAAGDTFSGYHLAAVLQGKAGRKRCAAARWPRPWPFPAAELPPPSRRFRS